MSARTGDVFGPAVGNPKLPLPIYDESDSNQTFSVRPLFGLANPPLEVTSEGNLCTRLGTCNRSPEILRADIGLELAHVRLHKSSPSSRAFALFINRPVKRRFAIVIVRRDDIEPNLPHVIRVCRFGGAAMFVRFVAPFRHRDSHCLTGIFYAACRLYEHGKMCEDEQQRCDDVLNWFNRHLPFPDRFSRSGRRHACGKGICWFKDSAARYIRKVRELAAMLETHGLSVEMLRTSKPGYVVYEDPYQIVAVPFRETRA
jgi:hypothetical protein